jgi:hypothetical protein
MPPAMLYLRGLIALAPLTEFFCMRDLRLSGEISIVIEVSLNILVYY